jgi:hypothetical protein
MAQKVNLAEMDFLCHFSKVGLLAPALVIEIVIPSFFPCPPPTHTPQHAHSNIPHFPHASEGRKVNQELGASR